MKSMLNDPLAVVVNECRLDYNDTLIIERGHITKNR